jgi:hypothetical protein
MDGPELRRKNVAAKQVFRNWSRLVKVNPQEVLRPSKLPELQSAVKNSAKIRVMGTGHSFNACAATQATLLHSSGWNRLLSLDAEKMQIKVEAGIKLRELNRILWLNGLAFPSLGDIDEQAMGGIVSTGTHGTGLKWGSFCDGQTLIGMELVLADGSLLELRADRQDDQPLLEAARVGLGAMGVIYSLSFQLIKAHNLEYSSRIVHQQEARDPVLYKTHDHFEYFPFPFNDHVLMVIRDQTDKASEKARLGNWFHRVFMENYALDAMLRVTSIWPSKISSMMKMMTRMAGEEHYIGRSYEVMSSVRKVRFYEMEYAFPLDRIDDALIAYHDVNRFFADKLGRDRYFASFPGEVRFLGADRGTLLSPTLGQPAAYLAAQVFPAFGPGYQLYFRALEAEFLRLEGRPHWGKLFYRNPMAIYPRFAEWNRQRLALDPGEKFINPFLQTLLRGENF